MLQDKGHSSNTIYHISRGTDLKTIEKASYTIISGKDLQKDRKSKWQNGSTGCRPRLHIFFACFFVAMANSGEDTYGRLREAEVTSIKVLGPPGLANPYLPSYKCNIYNKQTRVRTEPKHNLYANKPKEDTTQHGLRIATINVIPWSTKIITMITKMSEEFEILLIQEHHKIRKRDMKTGPYVLAGFAPAQKTVRTKNGRGWHTTGGVAILVWGNPYYEKDKLIPQQGLNWAAIK